MADGEHRVVVRIAQAADLGELSLMRALWSDVEHADPEFEARMAAWLAADGERRTVWLARLDGLAVGMASLFEYRRMPRPGRPDSRWGYLSNMFVREEFRNRGVGTALLEAVVAAAEQRGYVRIVLSPSLRALRFYERAGFVVPDEHVGDRDRLLVRLL